MAIFPIDKYLADDYRQVMGTFQAPQDIDTVNPLLPVATVTVGKGFPTPNAKQELYSYNVIMQSTNSSVDVQIDTPTSEYDVFFIGVTYDGDASGCTIRIGDATSGAISTTNGNTTSKFITAGNKYASVIFPAPIKMLMGLRATHATPAAGNVYAVIHYMRQKRL